MVDWCSRMCPNYVPSPSTLIPGETPLPCPTCPPPAHPTPVCPTHAPPPAPCVCLAHPSSHKEQKKPLPWKALQTYNSTDLGFYKFYFNKDVSWFDAQIYCEREGAHLLIINSEEEDKFVRDAIKNLSPGWIHIGVHDLISEGEFMTVLGQPLNETGFQRWLPGHPLWTNSTNCGWIKRTDSGIGIGPCSDKGPFICELSIES